MFHDNNLAITLILGFLTHLILRHLVKTRVYFLDFKIYSFFWTHFLGALYVSTFFILFGVLRFFRMDREVDLKKLLHTQEFLSIANTPKQVIILLIALNLFLLSMLVIKIVRSYFNRELYKLHLYYANLHMLYTYIDVTRLTRGEHSGNTRRLWYSNMFSHAVYHRWYQKFTYSGVMEYIRFKYLIKIAIIFENKVLKVKNPTLFNRVMYKIFDYIFAAAERIFSYPPSLILFYTFFYDCYYNNLILHKVFYVLPFYALFLIWYRVSDGLDKRFSEYDGVLFLKMYAYPHIMFMESSREENNALLQYMKDWFTFIVSEYEYEYTHCNSLHAKRFICTRDLTKIVQKRHMYI